MRVALPQFAGPIHWSALIAVAAGFYADEGLEVEHLHMEHDEQTERMLSGETPIEKHGADGDIALIEEGAPIRIIAGLVRKPPVYVYGARGTQTLAELRGKTLAAVSPRFGSSLPLRMVLADAGLRDDEFVLELVGGSMRRLEAVLDGRAAATILSPPASFSAARAGLPLLASLPDHYPNYLFSSIQANATFARANPETIVRYLRAEIRAQRRLADPAQKDANIRVLLDAFSMSLDDATACYVQMVERDRVFCEDGALAPGDLDEMVAGLRRLCECACRMGPAAYLEMTWLDEARRQLAQEEKR